MPGVLAARLGVWCSVAAKRWIRAVATPHTLSPGQACCLRPCVQDEAKLRSLQQAGGYVAPSKVQVLGRLIQNRALAENRGALLTDLSQQLFKYPTGQVCLKKLALRSMNAGGPQRLNFPS